MAAGAVSLDTRPDAALREAARQAHWHVAPEWRERFLDPATGADPFAARELTLLKAGNRRAVYRVDGERSAWVVKHYEPGSGWRRWLAALIGIPAQREWETARVLLDRGVRTPAPVAWFNVEQGPQRGASALLTVELPGALSLQELAPAPATPRQQARLRRRIADGLAELVVALHRAGFEHGDLHAGNLLVRADDLATPGRGPIELHLVDFGTSRHTAAFDAAASQGALAHLAASFRQWLTPVVLRRFLRRYAARRPELSPNNPADWQSDIAKRGRRISAQIARRRDRRAWQSNRDFRQTHGLSGRASYAADVADSAIEHVLSAPERWLARYFHAPLKLGPASVVIKAELPASEGSQPVPVVCKRIRARRFWQTPWSWGARRRARRAWSTAAALHARGLPVARPLALLLPRNGGSAYLLSQYVPGAVNLHLYAWELARRRDRERRLQARQTADALGQLIGSLHAWGIAHRDLKGCNLMVVEDEGRLHTPLVDLDGIVVRRRLSRRERVRNLARLAASLQMHAWVGRSLAMRFLRAYTRQLDADSDGLRRLWRDVAGATDHLVGRRKRRNAAVG